MMSKSSPILFHSNNTINIFLLGNFWYTSLVGYNLHVSVDLYNGTYTCIIMDIHEPSLMEVAKELVIKHNSEVVLDLPKTPIEELMNIYFLNH